MSETKKPGMFSRLFGGTETKSEEAVGTEAATVEVSAEAPPTASTTQSEGEAPSGGKTSWYQKLKAGLKRSSTSLGSGIAALITKRKLDEETLQDLEDVLIQSGLGVEKVGLLDGEFQPNVFSRA